MSDESESFHLKNYAVPDEKSFPTSSVNPCGNLPIKNDDVKVYPNQEALAQLIFDRIINIKGQEWMDKFKYFRLCVFTPNKNILAKQTLSRICETPGVLPKYYEDKLHTHEKHQALEFAAKCLFKLNFAEDKKFGEVLESVRNNPDELTFLIFDEAHHSATNNDEKPTPYQEFVNRWFIEDFDNIFCLFLSATPYNLLTNQSRFIMQDTIYNAETKTFIDSDNRYDKSQKFPKYEIRWTLSHIADFRRGWKMRLMALLESSSYGWLSFTDAKEVCITKNEKSARVFEVRGEMLDKVRIYYKGGMFCWTWHENGRVTLEYPNTNSNQLFDIRLNSGENLIKFLGVANNAIYSIKVDENGYLVAAPTRRDGEQIHIVGCVTAPNDETFLICPMDKETKFYLGLNYIINSMRLDDTKDRLIRHDEVLVTLAKKLKNPKLVETQIALYCLSLIIHESIREAQGERRFQYTFLKCVDQKNDRFYKLLKEVKRIHDTISCQFYVDFSKQILFDLPKGDSDVAHQLIGLAVSTLMKEPNEAEVRHVLRRKVTVDQVNDAAKDVLGGTYQIISDCLRPTSDIKESGRMAIIRTEFKHQGAMFKQSLLLAKVASGALKLEIIQDFGDETTLGKHYDIAIEDAKIHNDPELLRIWQRIQRSECEHKIRGGSFCNCNDYQRDTTNPFSLRCQKCKDIHTQLDTYAKLDSLPCLLILVDKGRMGDTFPESLIALDDRSTSNDRVYYLSSFIQEKGRLCRHTTLGTDLPYMYLGKPIVKELTDGLKDDCSVYYKFVQTGNSKMRIDAKIIKRIDGLHVTKGHADYALYKEGHLTVKRQNHLLLSAETQCGKTAVALRVAAKCREAIGDQHLIEDVDDDVEEEDCDDTSDVNEQQNYDKFTCLIPHWKHLQQLPALPKRVDNFNKYRRWLGAYSWPVKAAPNLPPAFSNSNVSQVRQISKLPPSGMCTYPLAHSCKGSRCKGVRGSASKRYFVPSTSTIQTFNAFIHPNHQPLFAKTLTRNSIIIMTPSYKRSKSARLNWNHLVDGTFYHLIFVRSDEYEEYKQDWGHLVTVVQIPDTLSLPQTKDVDVHNGGVGYTRLFMQLFASMFNIHQFYMADDNHYDIKYGLNNEKPVKLNEVHDALCQIGGTNMVPAKHQNFEAYPGQDGSTSFQAFTGPWSNFGVVGFRRYRPVSHSKGRKLFAKAHVCSFFYLHNQALLQKNIKFKPWQAWEDLDLCNSADHANLLTTKVNAVSFVKVKTCTFRQLYKWQEADFVSLKKYQSNPRKMSEQPRARAENLARDHLKQYRVLEQKWLKEPLFQVNFKKTEKGRTVLWLMEADDFQKVYDSVDRCAHLIMVLPMILLVRLAKMPSMSFLKPMQKEGKSLSIRQVFSAFNPNPVVIEDIVVMEAKLSLSQSKCRGCRKHQSPIENALKRKIANSQPQSSQPPTKKPNLGLGGTRKPSNQDFFDDNDDKIYALPQLEPSKIRYVKWN